MSFTYILQKALQGQKFSSEESYEIFEEIFSGRVPHAQIAAFLIILRMRGETVDELLGAVRSMRQRMLPIQLMDSETIDVCGTGGDGRSTLNISTAVSFVLAALGISVAKHGNRAQSSKSGGVDVLAALGIPPEDNFEVIQNNLSEHKLAFLSAFIHHPALKEINIVRKDLGVRTIFNLLGPLLNPANVSYQMIGVYQEKWLYPLVQVLKKLGSKRIWAVHGYIDPNKSENGVDEITLAGPSTILALENNHIIPVDLTLSIIESVGLKPAPLSEILGGNPIENAKALLSILNGKKGAYRDTVLINAAIALHIVKGYSLINSHGEINITILKNLIVQATEAIDSGSALSVLQSIQCKNLTKI